MKERIFSADDKELDNVLEYLDNFLEENDCDPKIELRFNIALEEMFVNVAHYAYEGKPDGYCKITLEMEKDDAIVTLFDAGFEYNPLAKEDPDITLSAEERGIGGLGVFMVKKYMDECTYKRENNENIFMMRKKIR